MAILQSCCCWKSLRKGSYACGIYTTAYFTITAAVMSNFLHEELLHFRDNNTIISRHSFLDPEIPSTTSLTFTVLQLSLSSCGILTSVILIYGLYKDQKFLLIPWIVTLIAFILTDVTYCLFFFVDYTLKVNPLHAILFTLDFFVVTLNTYALLCVISQYQELKAGRGRVQDDQNHRIPNCIIYSAQPTATSYLSSKRAITYNETHPTPTQSPTGTGPQISLGFEEPFPNIMMNRGPRKSVKFPDQDESSIHNDTQLLEPWTIDVKSPMILNKGTDTAPLIETSTNSSRQPGV